MTLHFPFDNTYARLPDRFYARLGPTPVAAPRLIRVNRALALHLGLDPDALAAPEGVAVLAGNTIPDGAEVLAMAYAGHQFGNFVPQLGDGRALLLGEVIGVDGLRYDIQLKGAGPTPFSRRGDGRAAIGPVLREYLVSEAMAALGIPTTRALAAVTTGDTVFRDHRALPGAVIARVATSFVRVGTFQYFAARGDVDGIRLLADHVIARNYPDLAGAGQPYRALLDEVVRGQAELIARWLLVGFVHGVMNTDNMSIACETIDYGPCAFMDAYDPGMVLSSIDHGGRYAYGNQPRIAQWNLARLAECLLPLLGDGEEVQLAEAHVALDGFAPHFEAVYHRGLRAKIGLETAEDDDLALARELMQAMAAQGADFTLAFRRLADAVAPDGEWRLRSLFAEPEALDAWLPRWRERLAREAGDRAAALRAVNPVFIPRNHRIEEVIAAAIELGDYEPFETLHAVLSHPFDDQPGREAHAEPPQPHERVQATFCGT